MFALGVQHALLALALQVLLARVFAYVPTGTRAQAVGAALATLSMLVSALLLGWRGRRLALPPVGPKARSPTLEVLLPERAPPWRAVQVAALCLMVLGALGFQSGLLAPLVGEAHVGTRGLARAMFATDAILLPGEALLSIGALLGAHSRRSTLGAVLGGLALLALLTLLGTELSRHLSYDELAVRAYAVGGTVLSALVVGFLLSALLRRLAFVELFLIAVAAGYVIYFLPAAGPPEWIASTNVPEEQILVALVLAPSIIYLALLTTGGSLGFLLLGGGTFDPGFRYELQVALRYLRSGRSDWVIGLVTIISIAGVCLGVWALIVVLSVMSGFEDDLKRKILGAHAHVVLEKKGNDFYEYKDVEAQAQSLPGVRSAAAFVLGDGMISSDGGLSGTLVKGVDPQNRVASAELRGNVERGSLDHLIEPERIPGARPRIPLPATATTAARQGQPVDLAEPIIRDTVDQGRVLPGIIIGRELSKTLSAYVGDVVKLVSPVSEEIGPTGPQPKLRRFRVAGIFYSGMYEYDAKFTYIDMEQAQRFFGQRDRATGVEIKVEDVDDTARIVGELKKKIGGHPYALKDWREMNKELFSALLLEKLAMFIILTFIVLVASFNIVATLVMIVLERGKEIAILKSLGATDGSIMKIFMIQGLVVGAGGALLGFILGVGVCLFIARYGLELDQRIFYIERLPVVMSWGEITAIGVAAVMISYLATIYPAMTAARLRPVEGLRDD